MNFQCKGCSFAKKVTANGGWSFTGCVFEPYQGKWIAEIKECPKKQLEEQKMNDNFEEEMQRLEPELYQV